MKKAIKTILLSLMFVPLASILVACNSNSENAPTDSEIYTVSADESEFYDITSQTTAASAGSQAYVKVVPEFDAVIINKVYFNGQECIKSTTELNRYDFTMPNEDVTISVEYSFQDNLADNFLEWDSSNENSFTVFIESQDDSYYAPFDDGSLTANVIKTPSGTGGYFTNHDETVFSTNQNVVPDSALNVETTNSGSSNSATAFALKINRTQISEGTTQIVLLVDNGHKFGDSSLLVCTISVENL